MPQNLGAGPARLRYPTQPHRHNVSHDATDVTLHRTVRPWGPALTPGSTFSEIATSTPGSRELAAVTGATGFIGRHLVSQLLQAGHPVRVLVRPTAARRAAESAPRPTTRHPTAALRTTDHVAPTPLRDPAGQPADHSGTRPHAQIIWGDITDPAAVHDTLRGAHTVFHLAACARAWTRDPGEFSKVNVGGTRLVCVAARAAGVRRLVHVSTELVDPRAVHGRHPRTPYQKTKAEAEGIVLGYAREDGQAVIVRPTRVYGPGPLTQANSVTRVIDLYRRGAFRVRIADGGARANYVHVADVVAGMRAAAQSGRSGCAYVLGGENASLVRLLEVVAEITGRRPAVLALPKPAARLAAAACELGGMLGIEPLITRAWVDLLSEDRPMSSANAEADLGYAPRPLRDGIAETIAWLEAGRPATTEPLGFAPLPVAAVNR